MTTIVFFKDFYGLKNRVKLRKKDKFNFIHKEEVLINAHANFMQNRRVQAILFNYSLN